MTDFKAVQEEFARWLRNPDDNNTPNGIEARRMAVYRRLVRNNIFSFLSTGFPVLKKLLSQQQWQQLVDEFVAKHAAQSPYFSDMGREFVDFLAVYFSSRNSDNADFPEFTYELAFYERMEVDAQFAVLDDDIESLEQAQAAALVGQWRWRLNASVQVAQFKHPVAWLGSGHQREPLLPEAVNNSGFILMVYRHPQRNSVEFMQLQPMTALMISSLQQQPQGQSLAQLQQQLQQWLPQLDSATINQGVAQLCIDFIHRGVLLQAP
ncbi:MAG: Uncharacterised protein [Pseudidiomarina mangrovi]|nr:MAG: Uncharacterised protein [Pseudidiomarina mangrovi]